MIEFKVINWDTNSDRLVHYDVMPYIYSEFEKYRKRNKLAIKNVTFEELKKFINDTAKYRYWSRCEYEVIVTGWPVSKNTYKLDVYEQIKMNLDNITQLMLEDLQKKDSLRVNALKKEKVTKKINTVTLQVN